MGKVIKFSDLLKHNSKKSLVDDVKNEFLETYKLEGAVVTIMTEDYLNKKQEEFIKDYFPRFLFSLDTINPDFEFDTSYIFTKYASLSEEESVSVIIDCSHIYAIQNKLTYAQFADVIDANTLKNNLKIVGLNFSKNI